MFNKLSVVHQKSYAYKSLQNGITERKHKHILKTTTVIIFQGHIPLRYWGHCVKATVYIINRLLSTIINGISPYEKLHAKKLSLNYLSFLGCLSYGKQFMTLINLCQGLNNTFTWAILDLKRLHTL